MTETWNWPAKMKKISRTFEGKEGVIIQLGDSLTIAAPNNRWAHSGFGHTQEEKAFLKWAHAGEKNKKDGWYLARTLIESGKQNIATYTAAVGCSAKYLLTGRRGLPPLKELIAKYNPQIAVYAVGISDIIRKTPLPEYIKNVNKAIKLLEKNGTVPILLTLTPYKGRNYRVVKANRLIKKLAKKRNLPLLDIYSELKKRKKNIFEYLQEDGIHLTWNPPRGPATEKNFLKSGYLLRCYLTVRKAMEVKEKVFDA
jgi:lysophospholipase L1-like esterase